ncbi:MAG: hypothetical protein AMXMBFR61_08840 [Fimbriimonadales bacterium]
MIGIRSHRLARSGFTMVEILVVLAITSVLMLLVFGPMIQSFNTTRSAQAESEAQDLARRLIEQISTDLANATYVRDNSAPEASIDIVLPNSLFATNRPESQRILRLPYAKIDFFPPAQGDPTNPEYNPYIDKTDPTLRNRAPIGKLALPLARGVSMVRYFVGLADPFSEYRNSNEDRFAVAGRSDNTFVLYRAEIVPRLADGSVNTDFFEVGPDGQPLLDDPLFFTVLQNDSQEKRDRVANWLRASQVITPVDRVDLIQIVRDPKSREPVFDDSGRPQVLSLLTMQPSKVDDEPASPFNTTSLGEEFPEKTPSGFRTKSGGWTETYRITVWRDAPVGSQDVYWTEDEMRNGRWVKTVWHRYPTGGSGTAQERVFDLTEYMDGLQRGNPRLDWAIQPGITSDPMAFVVDPVSGKIVTSLPREHFNPDGTEWLPSTGPALTYLQDANPDPTTINGALNYQYRRYPQWGRRIERFVRIRDDATSVVRGDPDSPLSLWSSASIVPGSEKVFGPDQRPGPNYGNTILYRRVPALDAEPGPNEYRINYTDLPYDPAALAAIGFNVNDPDVKAFILPRFEAGYIKFYSDPNYPMPAGSNNIRITYHFQLNRRGDVFTVDYATKEVVLVSLSIRRYDAARGRPHMVSLTNRVSVRNFLK